MMLDLLPVRGRRGLDIPDIFRDLDDWMRQFRAGATGLAVPEEIAGTWAPRMDVSETENEIILKAELPGLENKDIDISLERDILVVTGEKKCETEKSGEQYHLVERTYGSFRRSYHLPVEVEADKIDATFKDGILKVVLPKTEKAKRYVTHVKVH